MQHHDEKREAMMLISGEALIHLGQVGSFLQMPQGHIYSITPGMNHRIMGSGKTESVILEMAHGSDEDIVRLADDYGRCEKPIDLVNNSDGRSKHYTNCW